MNARFGFGEREKCCGHLQQRADPSRPRAEKYTIDTSLTNTSVCFVFPCLNAALKPVQLPGNEPKRLFYLHGPVATIKTRSVHVSGGRNLMTIPFYSYTPFAKPFAILSPPPCLLSRKHPGIIIFRGTFAGKVVWICLVSTGTKL